MARYHVLFYKNLLSSDGHNFKCLERQFDVESDSPSGALVLAEQGARVAALACPPARIILSATTRFNFRWRAW